MLEEYLDKDLKRTKTFVYFRNIGVPMIDSSEKILKQYSEEFAMATLEVYLRVLAEFPELFVD